MRRLFQAYRNPSRSWPAAAPCGRPEPPPVEEKERDEDDCSCRVGRSTAPNEDDEEFGDGRPDRAGDRVHRRVEADRVTVVVETRSWTMPGGGVVDRPMQPWARIIA
jgi:hypothetical protein